MIATCCDCRAPFTRPEDQPWRVRCLSCFKRRKDAERAAGEAPPRSTISPSSLGAGTPGTGWGARLRPDPTPPPARPATPLRAAWQTPIHPDWMRHRPPAEEDGAWTPEDGEEDIEDNPPDPTQPGADDLQREIAALRQEAANLRARAEAAEARARMEAQRAEAAILAERATHEAASRWRRRVVELDAGLEQARTDANQYRASLEAARIEQAKLLRQLLEARAAKPGKVGAVMTKPEIRSLQFALHPDRTPTAAQREEALKVLNAYLERQK